MATRLHTTTKVTEVWKKIGPETIQQTTIRVANETLTELVRAGRFKDREPIVIVDGRYRADPRQVKPFGKIEFVARNNAADAVKWILAQLREKSPYLGTAPYVYRDSHVVMLNGAEIAGNLDDALASLKPGDRVQIVNTVPYARKIEGATASRRTGRERRRALSRQAKGGVYRSVFAQAKQRFGRSMFVDFKYVKLSTGVKVWGKRGGGKNAARVQRDQVYPAIQIAQGASVGA